MSTNTTWQRMAILDGKILGTLVLPREPHIGSNVYLPKIKDNSKHAIHAKVVKIDSEYVYLKRR